MRTAAATTITRKAESNDNESKSWQKSKSYDNDIEKLKTKNNDGKVSATMHRMKY